MATDKGTSLSDYKLPVKSQEDTRNFGKVEKKQWFNLAELREGDYAGQTETDSKTSGKSDGQYTSINKKSGKEVQTRGQSLGTSVKLDKHTRIG